MPGIENFQKPLDEFSLEDQEKILNKTIIENLKVKDSLYKQYTVKNEKGTYNKRPVMLLFEDNTHIVKRYYTYKYPPDHRYSGMIKKIEYELILKPK